MSEKQEQTAPEMELIGNLMALAGQFTPELEVAPKDENEDPLDHGARLIGPIVEGAFAFVDAAEKREAGLQAEIATLNRQVAAWKGQVTRARAEQARVASDLASALDRDPKAKARVLPANPPVVAKADLAELLAAIDDADEIEVAAFIDDREQVDVPSLAIRDAAGFRTAGAGLCLAVTRWEAAGPAQVNGWGLYLDGELAAYRKRASGQLTIGSGKTFNLAGDVLF